MSVTAQHTLIDAVSAASFFGLSYAATNLDNLLVVSAYSAKPRYRFLLVGLTFTIVCVVVLTFSLGLAHAAEALPADKLRYLGLIPLALGVYQLVQLIRNRHGAVAAPETDAPGPVSFYGYIGLGLILLANSGDSVGVLTPVFADLVPGFILGCFIAGIAVPVIMSLVAGGLANAPATKLLVEHISKWVLPFLLILVGFLILTDFPSDIFII